MVMDESMEAFVKAIEFEKAGKNYYLKSLDKVKTPATRSVLELLADEEDKHERYLEKLYAEYKANGKWPDKITLNMDKDFKNIFLEVSKNIDMNIKVSFTEGEILGHAADLERIGMQMYDELSAKAGNEKEGLLFSLLSRWESEHAAFLDEFNDYYQDNGMFTEE